VAFYEPFNSPMSRLYISYRPLDSHTHAQRLYRHLVEAFGVGNVIMPTLGVVSDAHAITAEISGADAVLVVIGPRWRSAYGSIDNPTDPVRLEIAAGLESHKKVIPVLIGGAKASLFASLPPDVSGLAASRAMTLTDERWDKDVVKLMDALGTIAGSLPPQRSTPSADALDIFISYTKEDGAMAGSLAKELRAQALSTWTYEEDGVPGISHLTQVYDAIEACRAFVLIASPKSVKSHEVITEVEAAHEGRKMIIPIRTALTHEQFKASHKILRMATGTAVSSSLDDRGAADIAKRIANALRHASQKAKT
jgi:hypothetical protein